MTTHPHRHEPPHHHGRRDAAHGRHEPHHGHHDQPGTEPFPKALERMNLFQEPQARAAIADLHLPRGSSGLDVGCGVGLYALWLAEAVGDGGRVVAIEPTAERVTAARDLIARETAASRVEFRQGDGTAIDAPDATFDWLWCGDVLHHIQDTAVALKEFVRVVQPGGLIVIKESQVMPAVFLPGHPELERRIQSAEMEFSREEAGGRTFAERRQRTRESILEAGLRDVTMRTYLIHRQAPLDDVSRDYIQHTVFERNWGERLRELLTTDEWRKRSELCDATSPSSILARPDYYCLYTFTVFSGRRA